MTVRSRSATDWGYFDHNATTPMSDAVRAVWSEMEAQHWHNPSSLYRQAGAARGILESYREELADHFEIENSERLIFTSGATEANNAVIRHFARETTGRVLVSSIEHPSVAAAVGSYVGRERTHHLGTDPITGAVDRAEVEKMLSRGAVSAVSVMAVNNETGAMQPWREIADLCLAAGIPFHTDAAQWIGKLPSSNLGHVGYVTGSAHKFGGGKGMGFLILPEEEPVGMLHSLLGGPQEGGRRAGTENLPGIVAMVTAFAERSEERISAVSAVQSSLRDAFEVRLAEVLGVRILARAGRRLWNTSLFAMPHTKNVKWLARLSQRGFALSTGSACSAGRGNPSAVMMAMGLDFEEMGRVLRVSAGPDTTAEEWTALGDAFEELEKEFRA